MKFTQEIAQGSNSITAHSEQAIAVDGVSYADSFILLPDEIISNWPARHFSEISIDSLKVLKHKDNEIVLLGNGAKHRIPDIKIMSYFLQNKIGCEAMTTAAACRTYNLINQENRRVAACLLLEKN